MSSNIHQIWGQSYQTSKLSSHEGQTNGLPLCYSSCWEKQTTNVKNQEWAMTGEAKWLEHWSLYPKFIGSIPSQGAYLPCRFNLQSGHIWEAMDQCFSLSLPLSLKSISTASVVGSFFVMNEKLKLLLWTNRHRNVQLFETEKRER